MGILNLRHPLIILPEKIVESLGSTLYVCILNTRIFFLNFGLSSSSSSDRWRLVAHPLNVAWQVYPCKKRWNVCIVSLPTNHCCIPDNIRVVFRLVAPQAMHDASTPRAGWRRVESLLTPVATVTWLLLDHLLEPSMMYTVHKAVSQNRLARLMNCLNHVLQIFATDFFSDNVHD